MILWYLTYTNVFMRNSCEKISNEIHVKLFLLKNLQLLVIHVNALFTRNPYEGQVAGTVS